MRFIPLLQFVGLLVLSISCTSSNSNNNSSSVEEKIKVELNLQEANRLAQLPLHCMFTQYPNRLGQTLGDSSDIQSPKELHPTFYGCFDWHSAVHGHWSLVTLLKNFPDLQDKDLIRKQLKTSMSAENIKKELAYFDKKHNTSYERTYGWAWLLKLAEELHSWEDPLARELENNLQPLTNYIVNAYIQYLPKLNYPIRIGEHSNTAFGLSFAYDYAIAVENNAFKEVIEQRAKDFYLSDTECPLNWEPGGYDFLSPCLEEAHLIQKVLPKEEFQDWMKTFLPQLLESDFALEVGKVSDRTDGKMVHLDGVNFSRAWCLMGIAKAFPDKPHLEQLAKQHIAHSLPSITDENYEGTHWLGSFAIYTLQQLEL